MQVYEHSTFYFYFQLYFFFFFKHRYTDADCVNALLKVSCSLYSAQEELCFYSPVFRPVHSIADELQFKQREHIVQMPASGGSASLFSGHHHFLWCTDTQSPLEGVPTHGINSKHVVLLFSFSDSLSTIHIMPWSGLTIPYYMCCISFLSFRETKLQS